jgi:hypothetical protein
MQNPNSVTTQAFDGLVLEISIELGISDKRVYELLSKDNPYPKLWRLLNPLGRIEPARLRLIQADFNARCSRILDRDLIPSTGATLHRELSEAVNSVLEKAPKSQQKKEITEAIAELNKRLEMCEE